MTDTRTIAMLPEYPKEVDVEKTDSQDGSGHVSPVGESIDEIQQQRQLFTYEEGQRIIRKVDWHMIPICMLIYTLRGIDSGAISYVKTMNAGKPTNILNQLNISSNDYALTSTLFTLFYVLGEMPSNLSMKWATPRVHYIRILLLWSAVTACHAASKNLGGLLTARAFLGLMEAGLAPGIYAHLSYYYRTEELGWRIAIVSTMYQFCNVFSALITYGFSFADGRGLSGWQWVFIVQGLLGIPIAVVVWFYMPNYPDTCSFLTEKERAWVVGRLQKNASRSTDANIDWAAIKYELRSWQNYAFGITIIAYQTGVLGYLFWIPTIVASFGLSNGATVQLLSIAPAFLYWMGGTLGALLNDRLTMIPRPIVYTFSCSCWVVCLFLLAFVTSKAALYAIVIIGSFFAAWAFVTYLPWRLQTARGATSYSFVVAWMNGSAQIAGLWSAQIFRSQYAPRYLLPYMCCAGLTIATIVSALTVCWWLTQDTEREVRRIAALRRKVGKEENRNVDDDLKF